MTKLAICKRKTTYLRINVTLDLLDPVSLSVEQRSETFDKYISKSLISQTH